MKQLFIKLSSIGIFLLTVYLLFFKKYLSQDINIIISFLLLGLIILSIILENRIKSKKNENTKS